MTSIKEPNKKNNKWCYGILIGAALLILVLYVIVPLIIVGPTRIPDNNEITTRFSELLVQPKGLKGIESRTKEGYALFKYYLTAKDSFEVIEQQAAAKGWIKTVTEPQNLAFLREKRISDKLDIHQYEFVRVSRSQIRDLICVGYDRFLSAEPVLDFKNSSDMKVIENTTWRKLNVCVAGKL